MEWWQESYTTALVFGVALSTAYLLARWLHIPLHEYPPSLPSVPIFGSMPFLPRIDRLHIYFAERARELGPVFSLKISNTYAVVLNGRDVIHEAFVVSGLDFSSRPTHHLDTIFNPLRFGIIDHPYDAEFKYNQHRSLEILKELGFGQGIMENRISVEVEELLNTFTGLEGRAFDPTDAITTSTLNVIASIMFGRRLESDDPKLEEMLTLVRRLVREFAEPMVINLFPFLRVLPKYKKVLENCKKLDRDTFSLLREMIDMSASDATVESFAKSYGYSRSPLSDNRQLLYTVRNLFIAGTETLATSIQWFLIYMANNPIVQRGFQAELDAVVTDSRSPCLDDRSELPYVEATLLELMRIKTVVPLCLPHLTSRDTHVGDYFIPVNTLVLANLYSVHMDPDIFPEPEKFFPARFLNDSGSVVNMCKDQVIPFSIGRRSCLGEVLARQELFLFTTGILHKFDVLPPENQEKIDVRDVVTLTLSPSPFQIRLVERSQKCK